MKYKSGIEASPNTLDVSFAAGQLTVTYCYALKSASGMRTHISEGVNKILETIAVLKKAIAASEGDAGLSLVVLPSGDLDWWKEPAKRLITPTSSGVFFDPSMGVELAEQLESIVQQLQTTKAVERGIRYDLPEAWKSRVIYQQVPTHPAFIVGQRLHFPEGTGIIASIEWDVPDPERLTMVLKVSANQLGPGLMLKDGQEYEIMGPIK
jgi:hypothetical protein